MLGLVLWWWNELWYAVPLMRANKRANKRLPPGHMGLPFIGDMLAFLFYFKLLRRPDEYINAKRRKYGDNIGVFRSHLFGSACIIACAPSVNKFVFQSEDKFRLEWPTVTLMGTTSLVAVHGKEHATLRRFVLNAINSPNSLRRITLLLQPLILSSLQSWATKLKIKAHIETKKMTLENIGRLFGSKEGGAELESIDKLFDIMVKGVRAYPLNIPGFAYHINLQEENMALKSVKTGDFITYEQLSGLKYTNKVVEETIRMANVAAFIHRKVIKEAEYKGYHFPKGWNVILWIRYLHTNPENFEDPLCFNPDRWNEAAKAGTYQVFGGGPRICAGNMLARLQLAILLHHLSTGYKWELVNPEAGVKYLPHPIPEDGVEIMFSKL
ncbi:cytochrome P450 [Senna tora]|uniref:Cytochrome P450 n=1 Tax=Senna tora TaxID=362788 RepID=A0A834SNV9_9FABA|nr:cytochrome P450 [Senna tora]